MMRSMSALRGIQAALTRRWHLQTPAIVHHRQRFDAPRSRDGWQQHRFVPRCHISTSAILSSPASFHGLSFPGEKEELQTQPKIEEAEVVKSEEDKAATRESIRELTRAEMSAHSIVSNVKRDDAGDGFNERESNVLGPYEKLSQKLNDAQDLHQKIDKKMTLAYAQSLMDIGNLQYKRGDMDESQKLFTAALTELLDSSDSNADAGSSRTKMMIAQNMHALGTIHTRCGEYDEASRWFEESLKHKRKLSHDIIIDEDDGDSIFYRYELGKTYNGMAALEIMNGGDVRWEKAMSLFQEAESNFLHDIREKIGENGVLDAKNASSTSISKNVIQKVTPRHVESLVSVRSNMGELLRQRGKFEDAGEMFRLSLDMARMALENENEKAGTKSESEVIPIPSNGPSRYEQANMIVDLLVKIADNYASAEYFDSAAEAYEQALSSHVVYRRWGDDNDAELPPSNTLPATVTASTKIKFDIDAATTIEAAIRNNLAQALAQIGQDKLSLENYEASLAIKRRIGGDFHVEVAHTLMGMGALLGGPLKDFTKGLNCFKEALFIYRSNLHGLSGADGHNDGNHENQNAFFGDEDAVEIDKHIQNALKNISLIEAALLKDRGGASHKIR